jgi:group I intron endonuclease
MFSGIYKIINKKTNDFYIGSSKNIDKRIKRHFNDLLNNKHNNIHLQRVYNKYGKDIFIVEIIEKCNQEDLLIKEQFYLNTLSPKYNIAKQAKGGDNITNNPKREEIIKKITKSVKERYENMSDEQKLIKSLSVKGEKNPNFGNKYSEKTKNKIRKKLKNYYRNNNSYRKDKTFEELFGTEKAKNMKEKLSKCASSRTGSKNPFYGKHHTKKYKLQRSKARKGKYFGKQNIPILIDNIKYVSLGDASKKLNLPITTIRWRVNSNNIKFINYKYI